MSQALESEDLPPVLKASVYDVRYFAALLRGVNFVNRATITITQRGLTITVEEARTLLGTAFIFADIFDEYSYRSENPPPELSSQNSQDGGDVDNAAFEIPLNILIECLNIFGTAGAASTNITNVGKFKKWRKGGDDSDHDVYNDNRGGSGMGRRDIESYFTGGSEKHTGMRMSYTGSGYPLTLLVAEDASGPTTTCEIATFDSEPHLELEFDNSRMVLKIILKSSWLRDALSELDPSCEALTFIGNPPHETRTQGAKQPQKQVKPMLRIQAAGTFGSTEMDYPNDRDVLETFECTRSVSFSYRFGHISRTLRALQSSTKTSLRIDEHGLLSLQFLMPSPKPKGEASDAFIEFRCLALDEEL